MKPFEPIRSDKFRFQELSSAIMNSKKIIQNKVNKLTKKIIDANEDKILNKNSLNSLKFSLTVDSNSSWHHKLVINNGLSQNNKNLVSVQVRCPSAWTEVELLTDNNELISRTQTHDILTEYYIENCHNKPSFLISTKINDKPNLKTFYIEQEIYSPKMEEHYGYLALKSKEKGYLLIDLVGKTIVDITKEINSITSNITWNIEIKESSHKVADINLILSIIGKRSFQKWFNYDGCNKSYMVIELIYNISFVFVLPFTGLIILISLCKSNKSPTKDSHGLEMMGVDNVCLDDKEENFENYV